MSRPFRSVLPSMTAVLTAGLLAVGLFAISTSPVAPGAIAPQSALAECSDLSNSYWPGLTGYLSRTLPAAGGTTQYSNTGLVYGRISNIDRNWYQSGSGTCGAYKYTGIGYIYTSTDSMKVYWGLLANNVCNYILNSNDYWKVNNSSCPTSDADGAGTTSSSLPEGIYHGASGLNNIGDWTWLHSDCTTNYNARAASASARQQTSPYTGVNTNESGNGNPGSNCGIKRIDSAGTSATLYVDKTAPNAPTVIRTGGSNSYMSGANAVLWIRGGVAGSATLQSTATDDDPSSGIEDATFGAPANTSGWTTTTSATVSGNPASRTYSFGSSAVATTIPIDGNDNAGNDGVNRTITVSLDSTDPVVSISAPATATINTTTSPIFTFTVSDSQSGVDSTYASGASAEWRRQVASLSNGTCGSWSNDVLTAYAGAGTFSPTQTALSGGSCYRWVVYARDNVSNVASAAISNIVKVDTVPPTSSLSVPAYSTSRTISVSWNTADTHTGVASLQLIYSSTISVGGTETTCTTLTNPAASGNTNCVVPTDGTWYFRTKATDDAGNIQPSQASYPANVIVDTVDPTSSVTAASLSPYSTSRTISVPFSASDATSLLANVKIYYSNTATVGSSETLCATNTAGANNASYSGTQSCTVPADGTWYFRTIATDQAGNIQANQGSYDDSIIVDTLAPLAPTVADTNLASTYRTGNSIYFRPNAAGTVTLTATGSDAGSGVASNTFGALSSTTGWTYSAGTVAGNPSDKNLTWTAASTATTSLAITSTDNVGNTGPATTITFIPDSTPPSLSFSAPSGATTITTTSYNVGFSATDSGSGFATWSLQRQIAPASSGSCGAFANDTTSGNLVTGTSSGSQSTNQTGLASGSCYRWILIGTDNVGNNATTTASTVTVDATDPVVSFSDPDVFTASGATTYTVGFSATDAGSGIDDWTLQRQVATIVTLGTCDGVSYANDTTSGNLVTGTSSGAQTSNQTGLLTDRCYRWRLTAADNAGNTATVLSGSLYVDTSLPAAPLVTTPDTAAVYTTGGKIFFNPDGGGSLTLTATASDPLGIDHITFGALTSTPGWSPTSASTDSSVPYTAIYTWDDTAQTTSLGVRATNGVNLTSGATPVSIVRDDVAPTAAFSSPPDGYSSQSGSSVTVSWTAADLASGGVPGSGVASTSLQRQSGSIVAPGTCAGVSWADDGAPTGAGSGVGQSGLDDATCYRWVLTLTDRVGNVGESTSGAVLIDGNPPPAPSIIATGPNTYQVGETIWFNPNDVGVVDITATTIDLESGVKEHEFGAPSVTSGWSPSSGDTVSGNPSTAEYVWDAGAPDTTILVSATDYAGNTGPGTLVTLRADSTAPSVSWLYPGTGGLYIVGHDYLSGAESLNWSASDTESGIVADGSTQVLQRQHGSISTAGSCAGVSWTNDGAPTVGNPPQTASGLASGDCYRWVLTVSDNVGNSTTATSGSVLVDTNDPIGTLSAQGADGGTTTTRSQDVTVTCNCSDAESGIAQVRYATDGGYDWNSTAWISWPSGAVHQVTLNSGSGTYTILAQIQDYAGNIRTISTTITLQNAVDTPTLTAAALIVDCDTPTDQTKWQLNSTGVIYWPVGREICLVPTVVQPDGGQGIDNRDPLIPKYGNLTDWWTATPPPPATMPWLVSYKLGSNANNPSRTDVTWPDSAVGVVRTWDSDAPVILRFVVKKETAPNTDSAPYILVPYDLEATLTWCTEPEGEGDCDPPETINPELTLRIIAQNSGQVRP